MSARQASVQVEPAAKLYAQALFSLAQEQNAQEQIAQELRDFSAFVRENDQLRAILSGQAFSRQEREAVLGVIAEKSSLSPLVHRLAKMLISRNRLVLIEAIEKAYQRIWDAQQGIIRGKVTTAETLSDAERQDLEKAFGRKLGKKVLLEQFVEKSILGGLVVSVQGRTFDGSLKTTLMRLTESLDQAGR